MSTSNLVPNGARLDDCHSTIFSLADLSGIKWQKFSAETAGLSDDPVLTAFTKCLSLDILAVWRRSPKKSSKNSRPSQETFAKELWVFWWGEEPHVDEIAQHQGLNDEEKGCWDNGLSYECRTLLFKAIHNLVERCLLHENFVRIGQWFVKPLQTKEADEDVSDRFSFSFSFFLHGESSVCTTVEVARHKSLERLSYQNLQQINANMIPNSVILAPYGLEAKLSGVTYRSHDPVAKKLVEEWKMFYPLATCEDSIMDEISAEDDCVENIPVPPVVEIVLGGISMNYPSHFVLTPTVENVKGVKNIEGTETTHNQSKSYNYDQMSVPSVFDATPNASVSAAGSVYFSQTSIKRSAKSAKKRPEVEEPRPHKPRYFSNRIRVKNKPASVVSEQPMETRPPDPFQTQTNSVKIKSANRIKWNFKDSFKETRRSDDSAERIDRQSRTSNIGFHGFFHHRSFDNNPDSNRQNIALLPPSSVATPKDASMQQQPTPEPLYATDPLLQTSLYHQVPNDKLFMTPQIVDVSLQKYSGKDFVALSAVDDGWLAPGNMKQEAAIEFYPPQPDLDSSTEVQKLVDEWQRYQIPSDFNDVKQKRLSSHNLDHSFPFHPGGRPSYFCPRSKRMKSSHTAEVSEHPPIHDGSSTTQTVTSNYPVHQVSVGTANGELAGMALSSDPYAFDDVEDTISQKQTFSDISLKQNQYPWPTMGNDMGHKPLKTEPHVANSGKSELEILLMQNSPAPSTVMSMPSYTGGISSVSTNPSKPFNKEQMAFSMDDITNFMEDGVPTPPDDSCENRDSVNVRPAVPVSSYAVNDLQRMFPTPPSLESCHAFSPEGRPLYPLSYTQSNTTHEPEAVKREVDRPDVTSGYPDHSAPASHDPPTVLQSKVPHHPFSEIYQPLSHLSQSPTQHSYVPSWMVPPSLPSLPPIAEVCMGEELPSYPMNPPSTPIMAPGSATPCTPSHSSVRTPASVQPPSASTPGRAGGICSIESSQSYQTPSSHGVSKTSDSHGSAALFMNLLLSDSVMNVFRDKSFDQCALCVCNTNIKGADVEHGYLPALATTEAQYACSCGFSAIRNRMVSVGTGLFLEDELEVVGIEQEAEILQDRKYTATRPLNDDHLLPLVMEHCASPLTISRLIECKTIDRLNQCENLIVTRDEREALAQSLTVGLSTMEHHVRIDASSLVDSVHSWKLTYSDALSCGNSLDFYRLLVSLKPVLQDAIQRKRTSRSYSFTQHVRGPLTWREFCKEAGKNAEPQPIPSFLVGYDHDWLVVSPHALRYWEKLFLEPYSQQRDIVYLVVCPDEDQLVDDCRLFFRELSSMFESCRLGRLKSYNKRFVDGIIRIGQQGDVTEQQQDLSWLDQYASSTENLPSIVSVYARAFLAQLGPLLRNEQNFDLTSLHLRGNQPQPVVTPQPPTDRMAPPISLANSLTSRPSPVPLQSPSKTTESLPQSYNPSSAATIVLFLIDPFQGAISNALWRCFLSLQKSLPTPMKDHVVLQIVPADSLQQSTSSSSTTPPAHILRSLSFSTFAQCRTSVEVCGSVRSMTGFGPEKSSRSPALIPSNRDRSLYAPLYVLADPHDKRADPLGKGSEESVLYVSYCLSRDQRWLLATATDQCGEILESCCINIEVPPRRLALSRKQHRVSVRSGAIEKLWKFCVATCSQFSSDPWRVVVGKLGRLSHAEIKDWAKYLNKRVLLSCGKLASCQQCKLQHKGSAFILSACLTSLEPDASLRILPDVVQANNFGRGSSLNQSGQLKTPDDVSCTHIYVFPTSAETQLPGANQHAEEDPEAGIIPADVFNGLVDDDILMGDIDILPDIMGAGSPAANIPHFSVGDDDGLNKPHGATERLLSSDVGAAEESSLLQQPLALGYLVSTAPAGPLPSWFWATCPQAQHRCPVFMRSALHIQTSVNESTGEPNRTQHPLDSSKTAVVLRFVLESYNALSWLTRDPVSRDRRSCLPVHCMSLVQLYHTLENLLSGH